MATTSPTGWTVQPLGPTPLERDDAIAAPVPGSVHTALLASGLMEDPFLDENEATQLWIGDTSWRYATTLDEVPDVPDGGRLDLVCDGLDTVADLSLDGQHFAHTENMHRSYRFDVTDRVLPGSRLEIDFAAPRPELYRRSEELGPRPHVLEHPFNSLRKMACSFGWDWGIETATSGIWREVRLEAWHTARLDRVLVEAIPTDGPQGDAGHVRARVRVERLTPADLAVEIEVAGASARATLTGDQTEVELNLDVTGVGRWWPIGHGEQVLHDLTVSLLAGDEELDRHEQRVGFRTIEIDQTPDADGARFVFVVNERPIMVRGVNWIPDHTQPETVTRERYAERLAQAVDAECNLVRIWGGGIYSPDVFMDLCDELGLLVFHDMMLACCLVAEEEPLRSEIEAEAEQNIARLAHHPSLALINGNNENVWAMVSWGWAEELGDKTWGAGYYYEMFPRLVAELAPTVPYTPGSPFSPDLPGAPGADDPNDRTRGSVHLWEQWNELPMSTYRDNRPRFVAEFGWQAPPTWSTLTRAVHDDPIRVDSPAMLVHQKAGDGATKMTRGVEAVTGVPADPQAWNWAAQYVQAAAVRTSIGWFRSLQPHCTGTIWWQLNDCWPVLSWALVDGDARKKPGWYALREVYQPRLVTIQPEGESLDEGLAVTVLNDTDEAWAGTLTVRLLHLSGQEAAAQRVEVQVPARGEQRVSLDDAVAHPTADQVVLGELGGERGWWWPVAPKDRALSPAQVDLSVGQSTGAGVTVRLTAANLVVDATLLVDKLDPAAEADRALVTLLPGESVDVTITGLGEVDAEALSSVLVSANDFSAPGVSDPEVSAQN